jgi:hypothetical protein
MAICLDRIAAFVFVLCAFAGVSRVSSQATPSVSGPLPDSAALLQAASDKEDVFAKERQNYICVYKSTDFMTQTTRLYESFYIGGHEIERLLAINGVPLSSQEKDAEEARVGAEIGANKRKPAIPFVGLSGGMSVSAGEHRWAETVEGAIVRADILRNERRVTYRGRPAIQIDFVGNKKFKVHTEEERIAKELSGTIIVDEASGVIVRVSADAPTDIYKGSTLIAAHTIQFLGFDAVNIADDLYLPLSWVRNRYVQGEYEDFWLQSCRKYEVEVRILSGAGSLQ